MDINFSCTDSRDSSILSSLFSSLANNVSQSCIRLDNNVNMYCECSGPFPIPFVACTMFFDSFSKVDPSISKSLAEYRSDSVRWSRSRLMVDVSA